MFYKSLPTGGAGAAVSDAYTAFPNQHLPLGRTQTWQMTIPKCGPVGATLLTPQMPILPTHSLGVDLTEAKTPREGLPHSLECQQGVPRRTIPEPFTREGPTSARGVLPHYMV